MFEQMDTSIFQLINRDMANPVFDVLLVWWRGRNNWYPVYPLIAAFIIWRWKWQGLIWVLGAGISVGLANSLSAEFLKDIFMRMRPCHWPEQFPEAAFSKEVRLLVDCGRGYSFPSAHAANHFALSVFLCLALPAKGSWWRIVLLVWAFLIALGQVYVGVHYPSDVLCGGLLGAMVAWSVYKGIAWAGHKYYG